LTRRSLEARGTAALTLSLEPEDVLIRRMLQETRSTAVVGASLKPQRPSFFVGRYMQAQGYRILPVNPGYAGRAILSEPVVAGLGGFAETPDMVAIFRRSEHAGRRGRAGAAS
jgi:uncharacterized protein